MKRHDVIVIGFVLLLVGAVTVPSDTDFQLLTARVEQLEDRVSVLEQGAPDAPPDPVEPPPVETAINIGSIGSPYQSLGSFNWSSLQPGDTVRIHWRPTPYRERLLIDATGTATQRITIEGVAGPNGELPVIDGNQATTDAQFSRFSTVYRQPLGVVYLGAAGNLPPGSPGSYITIRNLEITGGRHDAIWTDAGGAGRSGTAAGLYVKGTTGVIAENLVFRDNGNGAFSNSNHDREHVRDFTFRNNYLVNNGTVGSFREHGAYFEGINTLVEGNRFGACRSGSAGAQFKDRSVGLTVRYNYFEPGAPGRVMDLVDTQSDSLRAAGLNQGPDYNTVYVYGNAIHHKGSYGARDLIHFGGDTWGVDADHLSHKQGPLWFFNNTVVMQANRSQHWRMNLFDIAGPQVTVNCLNNVVQAAPETAGQLEPAFFAFLDLSGSINFGANWVSSNLQQWDDNALRNGTITGWEALLRGTDAGFVDLAAGNLRLLPTSTAVNQAAVLPSELQGHPVSFEPLLVPRTAVTELGAYEQ